MPTNCWRGREGACRRAAPPGGRKPLPVPGAAPPRCPLYPVPVRPRSGTAPTPTAAGLPATGAPAPPTTIRRARWRREARGGGRGFCVKCHIYFRTEQASRARGRPGPEAPTPGHRAGKARGCRHGRWEMEGVKGGPPSPSSAGPQPARLCSPALHPTVPPRENPFPMGLTVVPKPRVCIPHPWGAVVGEGTGRQGPERGRARCWQEWSQ